MGNRQYQGKHDKQRDDAVMQAAPHTRIQSFTCFGHKHLLRSFGTNFGLTPNLLCTLRITLNSTPGTPTLDSGSYYRRFSYIKLKLHLPNVPTYRSYGRRLSSSFCD